MSKRAGEVAEAFAVAARREDPGTRSLRDWAPRPWPPAPAGTTCTQTGTLESAVDLPAAEDDGVASVASCEAGARAHRLPGGEADEPLPVVSPRSYDIAGELARGGLGRILRGRDRRLNRPVAIKEALVDGDAARARFLREVAVTARLQHPGIVPVYEAGCWPDGDAFYAMKLISGRSLKEAIAEKKTLDERLSLLPNVIAVAEAVAYAHDAGVIHRDLKPANVLVGPFGETVVIDWGVARDVKESPGDPASEDTLPPGFKPPECASALTQTGAILGTPAYMPPEQAAGEPVDMRADVYAIGAILYHVLSGAAPYEGGRGTEVVAWVLMRPPEPLKRREPGVPPDLAAIVHKAMSRSPSDRYGSAKELAEELKRFQTGQLVRAHHYSRGALVARWLRRNRRLVVMASVLLTLLLTTAIVSIRRVVSARDLAERSAEELILAQATTSLETDPTTALSWVARYPDTAPDQERARALAAEAVGKGVASRQLHTPDQVLTAAISPSGDVLVTDGDPKGLRVYRLPSNEPLVVPFASYTNLLAFSADGSRLVAAGEYGRLAVWDDLGQRPRELVGHRAEIQQVVFAPSGTSLLSVDSEGRVCWWDLSTGACRRIETRARIGHAVVGFDRASAPLAAVAVGDELRLLELDSGAVRLRRRVAGTVTGIAISRGATTIAVVTDRHLEVWDAMKARMVEKLPLSAPSNGVVFDSSGVRLAYWSSGRSIVLRDLQAKASRTLELPERPFMAEFTADGAKLAVGGVAGAVTIWNLSSDATQTLVGHTDLIASLGFSRDGSRLFTCGRNDRMVRVWSLHGSARLVLRQSSGMSQMVAYSPRGDYVATATSENQAYLWSTTGVSRSKARVLRFNDLVQSVAFSPEGRYVAAASWDHTVRWVNVDTGTSGALHHTARVQRLVWIDGDRLATATMDGQILIWSRSTETSKIVGRHVGPVHRLVLSSDRRQLASIGDDGAIVLSSVESGEWSTVGTQADQTDVAFLPGARDLVTAAADGSVRVWWTDGRPNTVLREKGVRVSAIAVSPDGRTIAAGADDGSLTLMALEAGAGRVFRGHRSGVRAVSFSPDGRDVVTAGNDHTLRVWTAATGDGAVLVGHEARVVGVAFSPDGTSLASCGADATTRIWSLAGVQRTPSDPVAFRHWLRPFGANSTERR